MDTRLSLGAPRKCAISAWTYPHSDNPLNRHRQAASIQDSDFSLRRPLRPLPPSPPLGPPHVTNCSLQNAIEPCPPPPALTVIFASSMNMGNSHKKAQKSQSSFTIL